MRLRRWAEACTVGDGSGYPTMSVLHPGWMPPAPGLTPTLKVTVASDVLQTNRAVRGLSLKLRAAVVVHYVKRGPIEQQCDELGCSKTTLHERIERAHTELAAALAMGGFCKSD